MFFNDKTQQKNPNPKIHIRLKKLDKFTVNFQSQSDEAPQIIQPTNTSQSMTKLQRLKSIRNTQTTRMKPSPMKQQNQNEDNDFEDIIDISQYRSQKPTTMKKQYVVEEENPQEKKQTQYRKKDIFSIDYSQDDQEEIPSKQELNLKNPSFIPQKFIIQEFDNTEKSLSKQRNQQSQLSDYSESSDEQFDLYSPSERIKDLSLKMSKIFFLSETKQMKINFLTTPIPKGVIFNFEIHKYKQFIKTQYELWLCFGDEMKIIATAVHDQIALDTHIFRLYMVQNPLTKGDQSNFLAKLASNFKRSQYVLYDHQLINKPRDKDKILGNIYNYTDHLSKKVQQFYLPRVENSKPKQVFNNALTKSLRKLYDMPQFKDQLMKYRLRTISDKHLNQLQTQIKISRNTTRNGVLKDSLNYEKVIVVKMQHNRFKLIATSDLSPLQLLAFSVVHLE